MSPSSPWNRTWNWVTYFSARRSCVWLKLISTSNCWLDQVNLGLMTSGWSKPQVNGMEASENHKRSGRRTLATGSWALTWLLSHIISVQNDAISQSNRRIRISDQFEAACTDTSIHENLMDKHIKYNNKNKHILYILIVNVWTNDDKWTLTWLQLPVCLGSDVPLPSLQSHSELHTMRDWPVHVCHAPLCLPSSTTQMLTNAKFQWCEKQISHL